MIQEGRRKFLRFLGAGAVSAPVAAKETALAMGLTNGVGGSMIGTLSGSLPAGRLALVSGAPIGNGFDPLYVTSEVARLKRHIASLLTDDAREKARREARGSSLVLDPDIAAMRSLSPAAARRLQVERNIDRRIESERGWIESQIANLLSGSA